MHYRRFFICMLIMVLIGSLTSLLSPVLLSIWSKEPAGFTVHKVLMLLCGLIVSILVQLLLTYIRERYAEDFNKQNMKEMLTDYFHMSYDSILDEGPTNLVERIGMSVNSYYAYYTGDAINIWSNLLLAVGILVLSAIESIWLSAIMALLLPVNYFGYKALNKELLKRSKIMQEATSSGYQEIISIASQVDYLKQSPSYEVAIQQLSPSFDKIYGSMAKVNVFAQVCSKLLSSINTIAQTMIISVVAIRYMSNISSSLILLLYSIMLPIYFSSLSSITNSNLSKRDMRNSKDFEKSLKSRREDSGSINLNSISSVEIDVKSLCIKNKQLSSGIKGYYTKGDIVWIKGESGCGKSTLMKLLVKFRKADTVKIDGKDIRDISNTSLRDKISYISQSMPIITGTLRDNLFFNLPYSSATEEKLLEDPILKTILSNKSMDSKISEGGSNLSGGEKQKIAVARALCSHSEILILDEITSSIDSQCSREIYDRIVTESHNKIIFIISHDDMPISFATKELQIA